MTSEHSSANRLRKGGILLVQCCHLPQFFYAASLLRRRLPGVRMDALVKRSAEVDFYLDKMSPFSSILNSDSSTLGDSGHERIVFPCFNRGYGRIKRVAWRLSGDRLELDYEAGLQPLSRLRLARSLIHSLHQPDASFREYFATFPHRPLENNVLFIESCHSSLVKATEPAWKPVLSERCKLTRVSGEPLHRALRQLRNQHFDSSITFFSGETGFFGLKTLPFLLRVPRSVAVNDRGDFFYCTAGGLLRYLYHRFRVGSPVPGFIRTILFIQTEGVSGSRKALETLVSSLLFPDSEVVVLCRQEDAHELRSVDGVNRVFELRTGAALENWRTFQALRRLNPGMVSAILSGRPVFRKAKLLFLLFCDRPTLVFNPGLECYFLRPSTIPRIFSREPFLLEEPAASRIAVVQTEHCSMLRESMARLRGRRLYPEAAITLVCKAEDAPRLENLPGVDVVFRFPEGLAGWIRLARQLRKERPEVISLIFSGRRVFSLHKLWVLLIFPFRSKLAFNASLDAYWLGPASWPRIFRKEPLLIESESRGETLLIQTDSVSTTMEALEYLLSVTAARGARIRLLCRAEDRHRYLSRIPAEDVSTWTPGWSMDNLKLLIGLCRARDVIAATLSGQPIFRLQKLAFFLLPARDRLVFNENSDCFYMARSGFARALRLPSRPASRIFSREPFLLEEPAASRIAVVQTEHCSMLRESMARLRGRRLYPEAAITLVCKAEDAPRLENLPGVDVVFRFPEGLAGWIRLARQLRKERPEVISLIFSGRRVFSLHKLWVLLIFPFRSKLAFNASLDAYWLGPASWPRIFRKEPLLIESESRGETLLIQTDSVSTTMEALEYLLSVTAARGARIRLLCRAEDRHRYLSRIPAEDVSTWTPGWSMDNLKLLIGLCRARDVIAATLSGQPIFRLQKLAFFLLPARDRLVFNENSDCFYMARSGFARALRLPSRPASRIFSREPFLLEEPAASRIAVVQTEHCSMLRESMARLRGRRLYPEAAITLVCKAEDAPRLENLPGVDVVFRFPEGLAGWIRLARQLRKERPEVISLIFSGRRVFSLHKLWVLLIFPFRSKLAFNASLDAYWLGPASWPRIFRKEPLLIESESRGETLLIQTDSVSTTMEALEYLLSVTAARGARIRLLCRAEDRHRYLSRIPAEDVSTWTPGWSMDNLKLLIGLCRARDVIAATLSGQPIFRLQKLAFFLLPARDRLVFNENSDCFYMARSGFARALRLPSRPASYHGRGRTQLLHQTVKIALWIPRFAYLLGWLTIEKLKRARHLAD